MRSVESESEPPESGFGPESLSLIWRVLSISCGLLCNLIAVYLTFVQLILQLKLCLYTIAHLLLEKFKISQVILKLLCHTISPRVGVGDGVLQKEWLHDPHFCSRAVYGSEVQRIWSSKSSRITKVTKFWSGFRVLQSFEIVIVQKIIQCCRHCGRYFRHVDYNAL